MSCISAWFLRPGVSNYFSSGARIKIAGAPRFEAEGFTEGGRWEKGGGVTPLPQVGGFSPGIFWKIASKWYILVHFRVVNAHLKNENLY